MPAPILPVANPRAVGALMLVSLTLGLDHMLVSTLGLLAARCRGRGSDPGEDRA